MAPDVASPSGRAAPPQRSFARHKSPYLLSTQSEAARARDDHGNGRLWVLWKQREGAIFSRHNPKLSPSARIKAAEAVAAPFPQAGTSPASINAGTMSGDGHPSPESPAVIVHTVDDGDAAVAQNNAVRLAQQKEAALAEDSSPSPDSLVDVAKVSVVHRRDAEPLPAELRKAFCSVVVSQLLCWRSRSPPAEQLPFSRPLLSSCALFALNDFPRRLRRPLRRSPAPSSSRSLCSLP